VFENGFQVDIFRENESDDSRHFCNRRDLNHNKGPAPSPTQRLLDPVLATRYFGHWRFRLRQPRSLSAAMKAIKTG
jgi:hypothetical protein